MNRFVKIAVAGEGGQGVQSIADILAEAGNEEGMEALYIPNFGIEQRGGVSVAYVQIADKLIGSPKFEKGDIVVALSKRAVNRIKSYVGENTIFVYDNSLIAVTETKDEVMNLVACGEKVSDNQLKDYDSDKKDERISLPPKASKIIGIPATEIANRELNPRVFNVIILGAVIEAAGIVSKEKVKKAMENKLGKKFEKKPELRELNFMALDRGIDIIRKTLVRSCE